MLTISNAVTKELDLCLTVLEQNGLIRETTFEGSITLELVSNNGKTWPIHRSSFYSLLDHHAIMRSSASFDNTTIYTSTIAIF